MASKLRILVPVKRVIDYAVRMNSPSMATDRRSEQGIAARDRLHMSRTTLKAALD
jgi:hypothetical protein